MDKSEDKNSIIFHIPLNNRKIKIDKESIDQNEFKNVAINIAIQVFKT